MASNMLKMGGDHAQRELGRLDGRDYESGSRALILAAILLNALGNYAFADIVWTLDGVTATNGVNTFSIIGTIYYQSWRYGSRQ